MEDLELHVKVLSVIPCHYFSRLWVPMRNENVGLDPRCPEWNLINPPFFRICSSHWAVPPLPGVRGFNWGATGPAQATAAAPTELASLSPLPWSQWVVSSLWWVDGAEPGWVRPAHQGRQGWLATL